MKKEKIYRVFSHLPELATERLTLRKMIVAEQLTGKPIKPILTLAGPLPSRNSFTFDLVFMFRPDQSDEQILQDTIQLICKIEEYIASVQPA